MNSIIETKSLIFIVLLIRCRLAILADQSVSGVWVLLLFSRIYHPYLEVLFSVPSLVVPGCAIKFFKAASAST